MLNAKGRSLWIFCLVLSLFVLGCKPKKDVNYVVNGYLDKAYFNSKWHKQGVAEEEWYYKLTTVDTPVNTKATSIGQGHWLHPESVRFEITENLLVGWRSFEAVVGADRIDPKKSRGVPVVAFRIDSHFDIVREKDDTTLEASNVISENSDRPWYDRRYLRVDFSRNVIGEIERLDPYAAYVGEPTLDTRRAYAVQNNDPANPKRFRFSDGYFDLTTRQAIPADIAGIIGHYGEPLAGDTKSPVVDLRHSFMRKKKPDYEPLHYPDSVVLLDENKTPEYDEKGFVKRLPIWERFGFFRTNESGHHVFDQKRGVLESNKIVNITRFNLWQQTYRADGSPIPLEDRVPKAVVYYTNVEHPEDLIAASHEVFAQWNKVFKDFVFHAQPGHYPSVENVPDMFVVRENSCNVVGLANYLQTIDSGVKEQAQEAAKVRFDVLKGRIEALKTHQMKDVNAHYREEQEAKADLEKFCSALEYYSQTTQQAFVYQRLGDLRFNMVNLITKRLPTGWSGFGPLIADPMSGEVIEATANVNMWYIDAQAARANEQIESYLGHTSLDELVFGEKGHSYVSDAILLARRKARLFPNHINIRKMHWHERDFSSQGDFLQEISTQAFDTSREEIAHAEFSQKAQDSDVFASLLPRRNKMDDLQKRLEERYFSAHSHEDHKGHQHALHDGLEMIDNMAISVATRYKNLPKEERFLAIRRAIYIAVLLHELGHNLGLMHNMAAASDAFNYSDRFWQLHALPTSMHEAIVVARDDETQLALANCIEEEETFKAQAKSMGQSLELTTQDCLGQQMGMYSSIMDYFGSYDNNLEGLGHYDKAAVHFGYGQLLEVIPRENLKVDPSQLDLKRWIFLNNWEDIPNTLFVSPEKLHERSYRKFSWGKKQSKEPFPQNAVPYKYCSDGSGYFGPDCKAFSFGPDMRTTAMWLETRYWRNYLFRHFARDQIWDYDNDFEKIIGGDLDIMQDFTNIMRWYAYYKATDPDFSGSFAEKDYLAASRMGLNHFAHVLGQPEPGEHTTVPLYAANKGGRVKASDPLLTPADMMVPVHGLDECLVENVAVVKNAKITAAQAGYHYGLIPLGEGRPLYPQFTEHSEQWYIKHPGTAFAKLFVPLFLAHPYASFPASDADDDPRAFHINWYKVFPQEVGRLVYDVVTEKYEDFAPYIDSQGVFHRRDLLDVETGNRPNEDVKVLVMPSMSSVMPFRTALYASWMMSGTMNADTDMTRIMGISQDGSGDSVVNYASLASKDVLTYTNPILGHTYRSAKIGGYPIGYSLIKRLNIAKERFERLEACLGNTALLATDPFCHCVQLKAPGNLGQITCCGPSHPNCKAISLVPVGTGSCSRKKLQERRDAAYEELNKQEGFADDLRKVTSLFSHNAY